MKAYTTDDEGGWQLQLPEWIVEHIPDEGILITERDTFKMTFIEFKDLQ